MEEEDKMRGGGNRVRAKMWRKKVRANLSEEVLNNSTDTSQETVL